MCQLRHLVIESINMYILMLRDAFLVLLLVLVDIVTLSLEAGAAG